MVRLALRPEPVVDHHIQVPLAVGNDIRVRRLHLVPLTRFEQVSQGSSRRAGERKREVVVDVDVADVGMEERSPYLAHLVVHRAGVHQSLFGACLHAARRDAECRNGLHCNTDYHRNMLSWTSFYAFSLLALAPARAEV